jgi:hypothetical protein
MSKKGKYNQSRTICAWQYSSRACGRVTLTEMLTEFDSQTLVNTSEDLVLKSVVVKHGQDQHPATACDLFSVPLWQVWYSW